LTSTDKFVIFAGVRGILLYGAFAGENCRVLWQDLAPRKSFLREQVE